MKYKILIVSCLSLFITGCGGISVPTNYTDPTTGQVVQYSPTDENILKGCAVIENNLALIRSGAALSVGGVLQASIKQPSTLQNDGALCWQISSAVYSATNPAQPTLPTSTNIKGIISGFTSNVTDPAVLNDVDLITSALNNVYASYYKQLQSYAAQTNNKTVQNTITKTGLDILNALAGGVMDGTQKYAPAKTVTTDYIRWGDLTHIA